MRIGRYRIRFFSVLADVFGDGRVWMTGKDAEAFRRGAFVSSSTFGRSDEIDWTDVTPLVRSVEIKRGPRTTTPEEPQS